MQVKNCLKPSKYLLCGRGAEITFPNEAIVGFKADRAVAHEHLKLTSTEVWDQKISAYNAKLALTLFMARLSANNTNNTFTTDNFTVAADFFY